MAEEEPVEEPGERYKHERFHKFHKTHRPAVRVRRLLRPQASRGVRLAGFETARHRGDVDGIAYQKAGRPK